MTDKELLELAAKAINLPECGWMGPAFMYVKDNTFTDWNPLESDSDALRLAVKLRMHVSIFADAIGIGTPGGGYTETKWIDDPCAATRRAITRAAAAIGEAMKS